MIFHLSRAPFSGDFFERTSPLQSLPKTGRRNAVEHLKRSVRVVRMGCRLRQKREGVNAFGSGLRTLLTACFGRLNLFPSSASDWRSLVEQIRMFCFDHVGQTL